MCVAWSKRTDLPNILAGALSMLSIHSPDSVFTALVSIIFIHKQNPFEAPSQCYRYGSTRSKSDHGGVVLARD